MDKEICSTECFPIGELHDNPRRYEDYSIHNCGEITFRKRTTEHMSSLQRYFAKINNFPISYKGIVEKIALCKCPITSRYEYHDSIDILVANNYIAYECDLDGKLSHHQTKENYLYDNLIFIHKDKVGAFESFMK